MIDSEHSTLISKIVMYVITGVVALLAYISKRQIDRIDQIERNTVTRKEYDGTVSRLSREIRDTRAEISSQIKTETSEITRRLDVLMLHVSDIKKKQD